MLQSWRWYGPDDPVLLDHICQAGASDVVSALHDEYDGEAWNACAIAKRKVLINQAGLTWTVVESIPVHPSVKLGSSQADHYTQAFITTLRRLAEFGIRTICYNFMPVVDWTRTDLCYATKNKGLTLRFDAVDFATYDVFILERNNAFEDYSPGILKAAKIRHEEFTSEKIAILEQNIIAGLPGSENAHDRKGIRQRLNEYAGINNAQLRKNLISFLKKVIPVANDLGVRLGLHPDDPPFPLFGLPRVVCTADDYRAIFAAVPSLANGIAFCTGSLGSRADNDLLAMIEEFAERIHFVHLRNVRRQGDGSFYESDHLDGDVDMIAVVAALLQEEKRRRDAGKSDYQIPMRPDHGPLLLDDINKKTNPGYSAIGRLKGLAELRGVIKVLEKYNG